MRPVLTISEYENIEQEFIRVVYRYIRYIPIYKEQKRSDMLLLLSGTDLYTIYLYTENKSNFSPTLFS